MLMSGVHPEELRSLAWGTTDLREVRLLIERKPSPGDELCNPWQFRVAHKETDNVVMPRPRSDRAWETRGLGGLRVFRMMNPAGRLDILLFKLRAAVDYQVPEVHDLDAIFRLEHVIVHVAKAARVDAA